MLPGEKPIRPEAAAAVIDYSLSTLYKRVSELPHCKRGKFLYFFESELLAWIAAGRVLTNEQREAKAATLNLSR